jgi:hypothetical protein
MGGSCWQGSQGPVDMSSHRRCLVHLVLNQRLQPRRAVVRKPSPRAWRSASALTRGGPPEREPTSVRVVIRGENSSSRCPWRRCVGPVDRGRPPRLDRGRSTRGPGARQGARARQRSRAPRSCRLATRGPNCGASAAQARATANVSSTPRVRPPSRPAGCRRCPPPSATAPAASSGAVDVSHLPAEGPHQSGDETADPGCGLVQHGHGCVSPPRSVEGSAALAAPRPIKERSLHEPQQLMRARQQKRCWPVVTWR